MTTELAFKIMLHTRGIHNKLGIQRGTVGKMRHKLKTGDGGISLDKKICFLTRAGYTMRQDARWIIPGQPENTSGQPDYLNEFPSLTLIGKIAGMTDAQISKANEAFMNNPAKLLNFYKQMA